MTPLNRIRNALAAVDLAADTLDEMALRLSAGDLEAAAFKIGRLAMTLKAAIDGGQSAVEALVEREAQGDG